MSCIYSDFNGNCQMFTGHDDTYPPEGCDNDGICIVEDDPEPECQYYNSGIDSEDDEDWQ